MGYINIFESDSTPRSLFGRAFNCPGNQVRAATRASWPGVTPPSPPGNPGTVSPHLNVLATIQAWPHTLRVLVKKPIPVDHLAAELFRDVRDVKKIAPVRIHDPRQDQRLVDPRLLYNLDRIPDPSFLNVRQRAPKSLTLQNFWSLWFRADQLRKMQRSSVLQLGDHTGC